MSDRARLNDLKDILELLYEKLGEFERELIISSSKPANFELKQRIKPEILPDIRKYEAEYWELYPLNNWQERIASVQDKNST
jgi:hypothetical protein